MESVIILLLENMKQFLGLKIFVQEKYAMMADCFQNGLRLIEL